jgi:hypothetical protein
MNKKELKRLAEDYFLKGKKLTDEERNILKESKYAKILKENTPSFNAVLETALPTATVEDYEDEAPYRPFKSEKKLYSHFNTGLQRNIIRDLGDEIDDAFNLDITNFSPSKFREIDVNSLKQFIKDYADKHAFDKFTKQHLHEIAEDKSEDPVRILYRIYSVK